MLELLVFFLITAIYPKELLLGSFMKVPFSCFRTDTFTHVKDPKENIVLFSYILNLTEEQKKLNQKD